MNALRFELLGSALMPSAMVLDCISDIALICTPDLQRLTFLNRKAIELTGWPLTDGTELAAWQGHLLRPDDLERLVDLLHRLTSQGDRGSAKCLELNLKSVVGTYIQVRLHSVLASDECIVLLAEYAADDERTSELLRHNQARFRAIANSLEISLMHKDRKGRVVFVNKHCLDYHHWTVRDVLGKTDFDLFPKDLAEKFHQDDESILATGESLHHLEENRTPDGSSVWVEVIKGPIRDADQQIIGIQILYWDVTERKHTEQALLEARDAADQASKAKSQFLAKMSHEIRTPMNGIIGITELLSHTALTDGQRSFVEMIEQSSRSLLRIVNDILDFSKVEAGKLDLELAPFDLRKCVRQAANSLSPQAARNRTEIAVVLESDLPELLIGDEIRLRQILVNLIGNAVKFTENGKVTIRVSVADGPPAAQDFHLHFSVADTGIGIPKEKQAAVFEAFSQADLSTTRQYGGTGLGLSIASQLIALMNGRIWLESEVGVGTTFHFTSQFPPASANALQFKDSRWEDNQDLNSQPAVCRQPARKLRILLAEDGEVNRAVFTGLLKEQGHEVMCVEDGQAAIEAWQEFDFDAIFMDVQMPKMDGLEATRSIRQLEAADEHIPIIAITAGAMKDDQDRCQEAGMDDYLSKPIDFKRLGGMLDYLVEKVATDVHPKDELTTETPFESIKFAAPQTVAEPAKPGMRALNVEATFKRLRCSPDQQRELVLTLLRETKQRMDEIAKALKASDDKLLVRASHSLKSAAKLFDANRVADLSAAIEVAARSGDTRTARQYVNKLEEEAEAMTTEIDQWLSDV